MADVEYQMAQLVNLAIGSPEIGAVNFNILQKVLVEMLKLTELDSATIRLSPSEAAKIEETYQVKPVTLDEPINVEPRGSVRRSGQLHQCTVEPEKFENLLEEMNQLKFDVEDLMNKVATIGAGPESVPYQAMEDGAGQGGPLLEKVKQLESVLENMKGLREGGGEDGSVGQRLLELEKHAESNGDQLTQLDKALQTRVKEITDQIEDLEKELGEMNEKLNLMSGGSIMTGKKSVVAERSSSGMDQQTNSSINNLLSRLSSVQHDLDNLTQVTTDLKEEQEQRQMLVDVLTEQVEVLKTVKADKTHVDDNLAAKADMIHVLRKVSHDHFENKMEQLNTMVEDTFTRLDAHEELWQDEVEMLKTDLEQKLDKMEFAPMRDYVNEKLKILQDKMKALASQRKEGVAAGSTKRVIKDVQCISCDNESVMRSSNTMEDLMPPPALPSQQSVKPYLTYKLDKVRKQQQKLPPGRNLHHFEEMLSECTEGKKSKMFKSSAQHSGEHLVNRYVGGSHTVTTPQQRVTRTGNFFETWGPIITSVNTSQQPVA